MKQRWLSIFLITTLSVLLLSVQPSHAERWTADARFLAGVKLLDRHEWDPANTHNALGAELGIRKEHWPAAVTIGLLGSTGSGSEGTLEAEASTLELRLGARATARNFPRMRPHIGAGLMLVRADYEVRGGGASLKDTDTATGYWASAGIGCRVGKSAVLGFEAGISRADVMLLGFEADAGGVHLGLTLSFRL
jgi:hypothetical protein